MSTNKKQKELFLVKYKESFGQISTTSMAIGIDRGTYYNWMKTDKDFAETIAQLDESFVEFVESKVREKIASGHDLWTWRYLKAHKPQMYKDEIKQNQNHEGSLKLEITNKTLTGPAAPPQS